MVIAPQNFKVLHRELIHITNQKSSRAARDLTRKSELGGYWIVYFSGKHLYLRVKGKSGKATDLRGVLCCRIKSESSLRIIRAVGDAGGGRDDGQVRCLK